MGCKYTIGAKNYGENVWKIYECTDNLFKAICLYIKARKYEYVFFEVKK